MKEQQQVVTAQADLEVTARLQSNRLSDLDAHFVSRDRLHVANQWLTYMFHVTQAFGVFTVAICQALGLGGYVFFGVGLNILASVFEAIRQYNTKVSIKKLKDIEAIRRGDYLDEGDVDIAPDRQDRQRSDQGLKQTERALMYKYELAKQERAAQASPLSTLPTPVVSVQSAIKKIDQALGDQQQPL